jgi:DUF4097 and DUF4098 domain-containing protein YvlB
MLKAFSPRRVVGTVALLCSPLPLVSSTGCSALLANQFKATATEQRSFSVAGEPSVIVDTFNGSITVKPTTESKVEAVVTKTGSGANQEAADLDLKNVIVDYTQEAESIRITAKRTTPRAFGSSGASVELKVPTRTVLSLTTQNGTIATEGTQGEVTARSSNGNVDVHGATGRLDLTTTNGTIEIDASAATVVAQTSNGNVGFSGTLAKGSHSLETSNGSVELKLPPSTQFQFEAETSNGVVSNRFPGLQSRSGKDGSKRLAGLVGSGSTADVSVKLETSNGSITIEPAQPAEAPRP